MGNKVSVWITLCAALASSACAAFRGGELGEVGQLQAAGDAKKSVAVVLTASTHINGKAQDANAQFIQKWTEVALKTYGDSGLFASVTPGLADADVRAEISLDDSGNASLPLAFLTGLTLYVIPAKATDNFTLKTVFKDRAGRVLGSYEKRESVTLWLHLFMLPVFPFKSPGAVGPAALRDLNQATLLAAQHDGLI